MNYLWKLTGLCLSGDTSEHLLNVFHGSVGRNGKSTFIETLHAILGELSMIMPFSSLEPKYGGGIPNDIARMAGKRLVVAMESNEGRRLDEALIKQLTGGDKLTGRFLHSEFFDFLPTHKLILVSNHKPVIKETSDSIWSRIRLIPFEVSFKGREDRQLKDKLMQELPEIFAWMVKGFTQWQIEGLKPPKCVEESCKEYRRDEDVIQDFIEDCCYLNENISVSLKDLYTKFKDWAERNGEKSMQKKIFKSRIEQKNFQLFMGNGLLRFRGIALVEIRKVG